MTDPICANCGTSYDIRFFGTNRVPLCTGCSGDYVEKWRRTCVPPAVSGQAAIVQPNIDSLELVVGTALNLALLLDADRGYQDGPKKIAATTSSRGSRRAERACDMTEVIVLLRRALAQLEVVQERQRDAKT